MEFISIIIMLLGIAVLVALYFMSRSAKKVVPKSKDTHIRAIRGKDGSLASSVKEDSSTAAISESSNDIETPQEKSGQKAIKETQLVLFIASQNESELNGSKLLNVMDKIGLKYGDMGLFHRMASTDEGEISIYRVANGVEPWTLDPSDLRGNSTPGLSLILNIPNSIDDVKAIEDFVQVAEVMAQQMKATLKNQQQEIFSDSDKDAMLALVE